MSAVLHLTLLLAVAGLASGATFHTSSASAGSGLGGGGTAFTTSTRFNNRPATTTSFTTGTGQTYNSAGSTGSGFSGLGTRGGFRPLHVPRVPNFNFRPIVFPQLPRFGSQTQYVGSSIGSRFGGNRFGGGATGFSTASSTGFNSIDTNNYFNRLSDQINRSFAANLRV